MTRTQIFLTETQVEKITEEAKKSDIRFSEMLRRIIDYYFKQHEDN